MKRITKLLAISMAMIMVVISTLSLSACKYKDPVDSPQEEQHPYGNYDYSKRAFIANNDSAEGYCVYKGDVYFLSRFMELMRAPLTNLENDLRESKNKKPPQAYSLCPDNSHNHNAWGIDPNCPAWLSDVGALYLIDAYESAGDFPIVYYTRGFNIDISQSIWDQSITYEIFRYDTGKAERECIASLNNPVSHIMTYDQWVIFVTLNSKDEYQLNVVSKQGGEITTITVGKGELTLLGVYNQRVIFRDENGAVYQAGFDLQNCQMVFQAPEMYSISPDFQGLFVHGKYLYYPADYQVVPYPISDDGTQVLDLFQHSVRRVSLDNPNGGNELVAENVLDYYMFGIADDVFYYSPCLPGKPNRGYYHNFTSGILKGVNLNTLEAAKIKEDVGLDFMGLGSIVNGDGLIAIVFPIREGYNVKFTDSTTCLYDIKTGALYSLEYDD